MKNYFDIIIVGGGAAGLFAAATLSKYKEGRDLSVLVLEKMEKCGRKIAITGKGRCNITNTKNWEDFSTHIHPNNIFFKSAFFEQSNLATIKFFEEIGLPLIVERGDRVFPKSMIASDVTKALVNYVKEKGVDVVNNFDVKDLIKESDDYFKVVGKDRTFFSKRVILCTGGFSYPKTGSTGDGYYFAKKFGHKINQCFPSLTAIVPKDYTQQFCGISLKNVQVKLFINGDFVQEEFGDLDFTNGGIEGPIGFKVSRKAVQNLINNQKVELSLDLKPAVDVDKLKGRINREIESLGTTDIAVILKKLLPVKLIPLFLHSHKKINLENLSSLLKDWRFVIKSYVGYERCVVTAGGISLKEVSQKTMESKLVKGLFFAGEVLDLDGDTGGYNLQIAFSTGALAALNALKLPN